MSKVNNPYAQFETNVEAESGKGVKVQYLGYSVTINRAGGSNKKYLNLFSEKMKAHRVAFQSGTLDDETSGRILAESFAEGILVGWEGVTDRKGKKIPFSVEAATKLLIDLPELLNDIRARANSFETFREEQEQADEKN